MTNARVLAALRELVLLKMAKDLDFGFGMPNRIEYEARKPKAWVEAKAAVEEADSQKGNAKP